MREFYRCVGIYSLHRTDATGSADVICTHLTRIAAARLTHSIRRQELGHAWNSLIPRDNTLVPVLHLNLTEKNM